MSMHCIAIDDEPPALKVVSSHASKVPFISLKATFTSPLEAIPYLSEHKVDLIFLDVEMKGVNGFQLLEVLPYKPFIILTTAYADYALQSYEADVVDFLLKPFTFERFLKAVSKVQRLKGYSASPEAPKFLFLKSGYQHHKLNLEDLLYVEGAGNYMAFVTTKQKILVRMGLKETIDLLPPKGFVRIHKSYIIAIDHLEKVEDNHVYLNNTALPIGSNYKEHFFEYMNY